MNEVNKPDFRQEHQKKWIALLQKLFPDGAPEQASWSGQTEIVSVLQMVVDRCHRSHYLYTPENGSVELQRVRPSLLSEGIELLYSGTALIHPVELIFNGFKEYPLLSFFRLITTSAEPIGLEQPDSFNSRFPKFSETVYRRPVMHYSGSEGEGGIMKEVEGSKELIKHYFKGGDFAIFSSVSPFGKLWDREPSLLQRHSAKGFRDYIQQVVAKEREGKN